MSLQAIILFCLYLGSRLSVVQRPLAFAQTVLRPCRHVLSPGYVSFMFINRPLNIWAWLGRAAIGGFAHACISTLPD